MLQLHTVHNAASDSITPYPDLGVSVASTSAYNSSFEREEMMLAVENGLLFGNYFWDLPADSDGTGSQVREPGRCPLLRVFRWSPLFS